MTTPSCHWRMCPNGPNGPNRYSTEQIKLQACSRCKTVAYCTKACQKKDWSFHKHKCQPSDVSRHKVNDFTIKSIQNAIDSASPGDIILLKEGTYEGPSDGFRSELIVNKPIKLWGPKKGRDSVKLNCNLAVN